MNTTHSQNPQHKRAFRRAELLSRRLRHALWIAGPDDQHHDLTRIKRALDALGIGAADIEIVVNISA